MVQNINETILMKVKLMVINVMFGQITATFSVRFMYTHMKIETEHFVRKQSMQNILRQPLHHARPCLRQPLDYTRQCHNM